MNPAYLHLISTHLPVVGTYFGFCLLLFALARKSEELKRTSLLVFFLIGLVALPAYLSGQPAMAMLKRMMVAFPMDACDQHAEVAMIALTGSLVLGLASVAGLLLFRKGKPLPWAFLGLVFVIALVSCGLMAWTANLGARVHHPEICQTTS